MQKPNRATYTGAEFVDWSGSKALVLTPKFQRRGVWQQPAKSFFIDTLLRSMPVPPIYIRLTQSPERNRVIREIIDGQQRITALIEFVRGDFPLARTLAAPWKGKRFDQLTQHEQDNITGYPFSTETFQGISDQEILEVFSRLNTYSVPLNDQELRNGKYFGQFKQLCYALAHEYLEYWRANRIFAERGIARMDEVELVSEILVAGIAGMQDKKKSLDDFYHKYDDQFRERDSAKKHFDAVMVGIAEAFPTGLSETEFHRPPLFYTLYMVLHHRMFGLVGQKAKRSTSRVKASDLTSLSAAAFALSDAIQDYKSGKDVPTRTLAFVNASQRQTDNLKPRQVRFDALYSKAFA